MFKNLRIKRDLKKRFEVVYDKENKNTYIKDKRENKYHLANDIEEVRIFFEYLIKKYLKNPEYFWIKNKVYSYDDSHEVKIMYSDFIIDEILLRTNSPSIFNEEKFRDDCFDIIKRAKKLKKEY